MKLSAIPSKLGKLYEINSSAPRTHSLDGTRGFAVLLVFFVHYHTLFSDYVTDHPLSIGISHFLFIIGNTGVDLFFILSGYLIYGILIQKPIPYFTFQWRRVKRIYPTFLCVLALYLAISLLLPSYSKLPSNTTDAALYVLQNVALLPGMTSIPPIITVAWTLSFEFAFYLSIPLLISMASLRSWKSGQRMVLFLLLIALLLGWSLITTRRESHVQLIMFGVGILIWEIVHCTSIKEKMTHFGEAAAILTYLSAMAFMYWVFLHPAELPAIPGVPNLKGVSCCALTAIGGFFLGLYSFGFDGVLNQIFSWTPSGWLGNISYSYYLIHGLTLKVFALAMNTFIPPSGNSPLLFWSTLPIALLMTLITATFLFALVEKPYSLRPRRTVVVVPSDSASSPPLMVAGANRLEFQRQTVN